MLKAALVASPLLLMFVSTAGADPAPATPAAPAMGKRQTCKESVASKSLRGLERLDAMQLCMAEGRLDCVKQVIAQKLAKDDRKTFLKECMKGPSAKAETPEKKDHDQDMDDDKDDDDK